MRVFPSNVKPRTMSIGGATYDLFVRTGGEIIHSCEGIDSFTLPLGEKVRVQDVIGTCGGGACNTSVGLSRLGCDADYAGVIGDDEWGAALLNNFQKESVDTHCLTVVEDEVSSFSIILSATSGERVILYSPGTNAHLHDVTFDREHALKMDWVYLNHIVEESCVIQDDLIGILAAGDLPRLTWNPGGCQIDVGLEEENNRILLSHTDLLLLNKEEALKFSKTDSIDAAIDLFLNEGAKIVCITDGKNGAMAIDGTNRYHCPIIDQDVTDTTGAGDAFGTGMTWALLNGEDLPVAIKAGTINAASVVRSIGTQAGLLTDIEMRKQLKDTPIDVAEESL